MTHCKPGTEFAAFVLIFLLWLSTDLRWSVFFGVMAVGWALNLWTLRRPVREPMPDWMEPPR